MLKYYFLLLSFFYSIAADAQKITADSLIAELAKEKKDTNKVKLLWRLADACNSYNPDTAILVAQQALFLARKIKYTAGESSALATLATGFITIGNYPRALELFLSRLKIEEKRDKPYNLASIITSIGIVYFYQEEYNKALSYYFKADSIIDQNKLADLKYYSVFNIGYAYNRLDMTDSAYLYFQRSLELAIKLKNDDFRGTSMVGLAHSFVKQQKPMEALLYYETALPYLYKADDEEWICEATISLAKLFNSLNRTDSALYYAHTALGIAKKDGFLSLHLEIAGFLAGLYKNAHQMDSTVVYLEQAQMLRDSISSKEKVRELQIILSDEQFRQRELEEERKRAKDERRQQLQLLFIGIFIPGIFLVTLLFSRIRIHVRVVKFMGVISLLILFEYLTLLLHPNVAELTHHTPVLELLIFVIIASLLIPAHHHLEAWLIDILTRGKKHADGFITLRTKKMKMKKP